MNYNKLVANFVLSVAVCHLSGCASYEPIEIPTDNVPAGPGIFSGDKGHFEVDLD